MKSTIVMNSFPKTFAPHSQLIIDTNESGWESVPEKSRKKSQKSVSQVGCFEVKKTLQVTREIDKTHQVTREIDKTHQVTREIDKMSIKSARSDETTSIKSDETRFNRPREPRRPPTGIYVNLGPEWKQTVRGLVPNNLAGTDPKKVETILNKISEIKTQVSPFEFKKIVCMFLHQAIKTDNNTLIERIIKQWSAARYNPIELIDSVYDECRPIIQACWSGSIFSIRLLVSADTTGQILSSVHPKKGETILETLAKGKIYALEKNPSSAIFIIDKFERCERYIRDAMAAAERRNASAASERQNASDAADSQVESKQSYDPKIIEEIELIKSTNSDIVSELSFKLAELFMSDNKTTMSEYFGAIKTLVDKEIVEQIETNLTNEGIDLV